MIFHFLQIICLFFIKPDFLSLLPLLNLFSCSINYFIPVSQILFIFFNDLSMIRFRTIWLVLWLILGWGIHFCNFCGFVMSIFCLDIVLKNFNPFVLCLYPQLFVTLYLKFFSINFFWFRFISSLSIFTSCRWRIQFDF